VNPVNDDLIERIWREAPEERTMSHEQLVGVLEPRVERSSRVLHHYVWTYLLLQVATLVLAGANLVGYSSNAAMLAVEAGIGLFALTLVVHGVRLYGKVQRLERLDESLESTLRRRLAFYSSNATTWMWLAAFSLVGFAFALNSLIDNADGNYPINHPLVFFGVQVAMVLVFAASCHVAHEPRMRELRAVLADLEAQVLDRTQEIDAHQGRWKALRTALIVLLAAAMLLGAWLAWRGGV